MNDITIELIRTTASAIASHYADRISDASESDLDECYAIMRFLPLLNNCAYFDDLTTDDIPLHFITTDDALDDLDMIECDAAIALLAALRD